MYVVTCIDMYHQYHIWIIYQDHTSLGVHWVEFYIKVNNSYMSRFLS